MAPKKPKRPNQTSFRLSEETAKRLDDYCKGNGLKKQFVVESAIKEYLDAQSE